MTSEFSTSVLALHISPPDVVSESAPSSRSATPSTLEPYTLDARLAPSTSHPIPPDSVCIPLHLHEDKDEDNVKRPDTASLTFASQTIYLPSRLAHTRPTLAHEEADMLREDFERLHFPENPSPRLAELAQLLRTRNDIEGRCSRLAERLSRSRQLHAVAARLHRLAFCTRRALVESLRMTDQSSFASIYYDFQELWTAFDDVKRKRIDDVNRNGSLHTISSLRDFPKPPSAFLSSLPLDTQKDLVDFLVKVRTDPNFVASRICRLSPQRLSTLTTIHGIQSATQSVFGYMSPRSDRSSPKKISSKPAEMKEYLSGLERQDPYSTLIFMPFAIPTKFNSYEDLLRTDMAATICSKLLLRSRPGADQFLFKILDTWANLWDWPGKQKLEFYLLEVLNDGEIIVGDTQTEPDSGSPIGLENNFESFLERSTSKLLNLLTADTEGVNLPTGFRIISKSIFEKLQLYPKLQNSVFSAILNKWFFGQFLHRTISYPECFNMFMHVHITDRARTRILQGIADQLLKFSLANSFHLAQTESQYTSITPALENVTLWIKKSTSAENQLMSQQLNHHQSITTDFLAICPTDIVTLANTLFPDSTQNSMSVLEQLERLNSASSTSIPSPRSIPSSSTSVHGDGSSILSKSASSLTSLSTHREYFQEGLDTDDRSEYDMISASPVHSDGAFPTSTYSQKIKNACDTINTFMGKCEDSSPFDSSWDILLVSSDHSRLMTESTETQLEDLSAFQNQPVQQIPSIMVETAVSDLLREYKLPESTAVGHFRQRASYHVLEKMFQDSMKYHQNSFEYWKAQKLSADLKAFREFFSSSKGGEACDRMIFRIRDHTLDQTTKTHADIVHLENSLSHLDAMRSEKTMNFELAAMDALRNKIWFATDVRTSRSYEEASGIAKALRMIRLQKHKLKPTALVRHRNSSKSPGNTSQIADLMTAVPNQGGYEKLNDEQVDVIKKWIRQVTTETSYCTGEEIIHRLNLEISRCIMKLVGSNFLESPVLWTSELYRRERESFDTSIRRSTSSAASNAASYSLETNGFKGRISARIQDQEKTTSTSDVFWSPRKNTTGDTTFSFNSRLSPPRKVPGGRQNAATPREVQAFLAGLRQSLIGFFFSDLVTLVFPRGSETDEWMCSDLVAAAIKDRSRPHPQDMHMRTSPMNFVTGEMVKDDRIVPQSDQKPRISYDSPVENGNLEERFDYDSAYSHFLSLFDKHPDPYEKLNALRDIEKMTLTVEASAAVVQTSPSNVSQSVMHRLLQNPEMRPKSLFRNLQCLTSLMSESIDRSPYSTAFQAFAQATIEYKHNVCQSLILTADQIVAYHTQNRRSHPPMPSMSLIPDSFLPPAPHNSMEAAAKLWLITAKEGHAIAQRELATFYLTHPELLPRAMLPLTSPKHVFQPEQVQRQTDLGPQMSDPYIMCIALHWMEESARGGDALALGYLREREEFGAIP